jgi:hypothetical protein
MNDKKSNDPWDIKWLDSYWRKWVVLEHYIPPKIEPESFKFYIWNELIIRVTRDTFTYKWEQIDDPNDIYLSMLRYMDDASDKTKWVARIDS